MSSLFPALNLHAAAAPVHVDLRCPSLPLAVYREVAAHLRQCTGVSADVLPQSVATFSYRHSQAGGLRLSYGPDTGPIDQQHVEAILCYYADRHGAWELIDEK